MSHRRNKAGKWKGYNPNRPRSRNNPSGKRNDPKVDWTQYNKNRKSEGRNYAEWLPKIAGKARELLGISKRKRDRRV